MHEAAALHAQTMPPNISECARWLAERHHMNSVLAPSCIGAKPDRAHELMSGLRFLVEKAQRHLVGWQAAQAHEDEIQRGRRMLAGASENS